MSTTAVAKTDDDAIEVHDDLMYRLATDPNVDVDKLERLIAMKERADAQAAKAAFTRAFAKMQGALPEVKKLGLNPTLGSSYAKFEDIQRAIRPVLEKHGFALNFFVNSGDVMSITARLSHQEGHYEETTVNVGDPSELKNRGVNNVQAKGSAISYAKRYATGALLNIVTVDEDDDGAAAGVSEQPDEPPDGYEKWVADMAAVADEGIGALKAAWKNSPIAHRAYITEHEPDRWTSIKVTAEQAA